MSSVFQNPEDDVAIRTRRDAEGEGRRPEVEDARSSDREVTLNTGIVLAIFFALALLCAVFFGFGYSMGRKSVPPPIAQESEPVPTESGASSSGLKPSSGSSAAHAVPDYVPSSGSAIGSDRSASAATHPAAPSADATALGGSPASAGRTTPAGDAATQKPAPIVRTSPPAAAAAAPTPAATVGGSGTMYVQIAAVSHQEDADVLLSALRRRGYTVLTRSDPGDRLIHVQVGPYANRKDAEDMRKKLMSEGYNAFVK